MSSKERKALMALASRSTGDPHLDQMVKAVVAEKLGR